MQARHQRNYCAGSLTAGRRPDNGAVKSTSRFRPRISTRSIPHDGQAAAVTASGEAAAAAAAAAWPTGWGNLVERCSASDWSTPLPGHDGPPSIRPVVALGKFDALHRGHMALAAAAARLGGSPLLLSFSGMAEVLGWADRLPLVPPCDRSRVLALWAQELGLIGSPPLAQQQQQHQHQFEPAVRQRYVPFTCIRHRSPEDFVELLARDLRAVGVVAGANYRFGYKAAGDAAALQRLAKEYGLSCATVDLVASEAGSSSQQQQQGGEGTSPPVSSSRIRDLLAAGDVASVAQLLGRPYRLVAAVTFGGAASANGDPQQATPDPPPPRPAGVFSTSSMDGTESEAVPLRLWDGGASALVGPTGLLNTAPGAGRYAAALTVHAGATPADQLLHLEAKPVPDSPMTVEVVIGREGLLLPSGPLLRAMANGAADGQALVVLDFERRV